MSTLETNLIQPSTGTTLTVGSSGDTITVPSGATVSGAIANTPAFHAFLNTTQTISDDTVTTVQFNTESFDTDSAYDTSNYRFTPQTAGKYYVYAAINHNPSSSTNVQQAGILIRKNGSGITENFFSCGTNQIDSVVVVGSIIVDLNGSSDYVDVAGSQAISSGTNRFTGDSTQSRTYFGAYKIIGA